MADHDISTGSTAQPYNMGVPISIVPFSYDAAVDGGVSGDNYKLAALPENSTVLGIVLTTVGGADGADTFDLGTASGGAQFYSSWTFGSASATILNSTVALVPASGGIWLHADATFTVGTIVGKAIVAYTNLDQNP